MGLASTLARRNLLQRPARTIFSILGIAVLEKSHLTAGESLRATRAALDRQRTGQLEALAACDLIS